MLPRVSAALAQFIAPIASAGKQNQSRQAFERFDPKKKKQQQPGNGETASQQHPGPPQDKLQAQAKIIPFPKSGGAQPEANPAPVPAGISHALLQLMNLLHEQRATIMRWLGNGVYQSSARLQKKGGRIRKGTILDERAE